MTTSRTVTRECSSTKGEWSTPGHPRYCPSCKALMPTDNGPLRSWHSMKNIDQERSEQGQTSPLAMRLGKQKYPWETYNRTYYYKNREQILARRRAIHAAKRAA